MFGAGSLAAMVFRDSGGICPLSELFSATAGAPGSRGPRHGNTTPCLANDEEGSFVKFRGSPHSAARSRFICLPSLPAALPSSAAVRRSTTVLEACLGVKLIDFENLNGPARDTITPTAIVTLYKLCSTLTNTTNGNTSFIDRNIHNNEFG
jgi:hypothetical protein